jgi:hypothetical protein
LRRAATQAFLQTNLAAARKASIANGQVIAQGNVLRAIRAVDNKVNFLRNTKGSFGFGNKAPPGLGKETQTSAGFAIRSLLARDPYELAEWGNVHVTCPQYPRRRALEFCRGDRAHAAEGARL